MKIIITIPTPQGSKLHSTDYVKVQKIMDTVHIFLKDVIPSLFTADTKELFKNAKVEKQL